MVKPKTNYIVNMFLTLTFLILAITGLVIYFILPSGVRGGGEFVFLGITKHLWKNIHNWTGLAFIALSVLHFIFYRKFMIAMTKKTFGGKK